MNTAGSSGVIVGMVGIALSFVFGSILADPVIDAITVALTNASIGSFAGAASVGGLIPLVYFTVVILIGLGSMALIGFTGAGLVRGRR